VQSHCMHTHTRKFINAACKVVLRLSIKDVMYIDDSFSGIFYHRERHTQTVCTELFKLQGRRETEHRCTAAKFKGNSNRNKGLTKHKIRRRIHYTLSPAIHGKPLHQPLKDKPTKHATGPKRTNLPTKRHVVKQKQTPMTAVTQSPHPPTKTPETKI